MTGADHIGTEPDPGAPQLSDLERLVAAGRVARPLRRGLPQPLRLGSDPYALSRALAAMRGRHLETVSDTSGVRHGHPDP